MNPMMQASQSGAQPGMPGGLDMLSLLAMLQQPGALAANGQQAPPMSSPEATLMAMLGGPQAPQPPVSPVPDLNMILQMLLGGGGGMGGMGGGPGMMPATPGGPSMGMMPAGGAPGGY